jgi:hypothetical protein
VSSAPNTATQSQLGVSDRIAQDVRRQTDARRLGPPKLVDEVPDGLVLLVVAIARPTPRLINRTRRHVTCHESAAATKVRKSSKLGERRLGRSEQCGRPAAGGAGTGSVPAVSASSRHTLIRRIGGLPHIDLAARLAADVGGGVRALVRYRDNPDAAAEVPLATLAGCIGPGPRR